jgi:hypothetical protein
MQRCWSKDYHSFSKKVARIYKYIIVLGLLHCSRAFILTDAQMIDGGSHIIDEVEWKDLHGNGSLEWAMI